MQKNKLQQTHMPHSSNIIFKSTLFVFYRTENQGSKKACKLAPLGKKIFQSEPAGDTILISVFQVVSFQIIFASPHQFTPSCGRDVKERRGQLAPIEVSTKNDLM